MEFVIGTFAGAVVVSPIAMAIRELYKHKKKAVMIELNTDFFYVFFFCLVIAFVIYKVMKMDSNPFKDDDDWWFNDGGDYDGI